MAKTMAEVLAEHHMSHAGWDDNQFAIFCHCGTEVSSEDNGDEAYQQEEALFAAHVAAALTAAGYGLVADAKREAWDECVEEAADRGLIHELDAPDMCTLNPYRKASQ